MNIIAVNNYAQDIIGTASLVTDRFDSTTVSQINTPTDTTTHNIALKSANTLFLKLQSLRTLSPMMHSLEELQHELIRDIQCFEQSLKLSGMPAMLVLIYRYLLCTVVDEAVLSSDWSKHHLWGQHSLLNIFHQDNEGGEKFFILLDKMKQLPQCNIAVLEFIYFCLSLGFVGKYQLHANGLQQLETLRQQLYALLYQQSASPIALSISYQSPVTVPDTLDKWWQILLLLFPILIVFFAFKFLLMQQVKPILHTVQQLMLSYANIPRVLP